MKLALQQFKEDQWHDHHTEQKCEDQAAQLVLCFGARALLESSEHYQMVKNKFVNAQIAYCSTAGEIFNDEVEDNTIVALSMAFEKSTFITRSVDGQDFENAKAAAEALVCDLPVDNLKYILVLSDGGITNGSLLVEGLQQCFDQKVLITGGLAGDGADFVKTVVGLNEPPTKGKICCVAFYGNSLIVQHSSQGGWESFGPERLITKSADNVLYEIDNKNALELYKKYLGSEADNLPSSALLFPLSVILPNIDEPVVRTILNIDNDNGSMTFAGNVPQGSRVRFMKANFDKLTYAATSAAQIIRDKCNCKPQFALLISCVGRKIILGPRIDEEIEAVKESLGKDIVLAGFYSYGEISPFNNGVNCQLHNQTMTITTFHELP